MVEASTVRGLPAFGLRLTIIVGAADGLAGAADGLGYASTEYRARYRSTVYVVLPRGCGLRGCGGGVGGWWGQRR